MALEDRIRSLRKTAIKRKTSPVSGAYQGLTKDRIAAVLREIDRYTADQCDVVYLDTRRPAQALLGAGF